MTNVKHVFNENKHVFIYLEKMFSIMEYPPVTQRIKYLIDNYAEGSVRKFSQMIELSSSQKLNRLFNLDKRNNKYPEPSYDIIQSIANKFSTININWLMMGSGDMMVSNARMVQEHPTEYLKNNNGNKYLELDNGKYKIVAPVVPAQAYARYVSECCDVEYIEELEKVEFIVNHIGRGKYVSFEIKGDSMDDDSKRSIPDRSLVLCRELKQDLWQNKLHLKKYPYWIIVHQNTILCKEILEHDVEKGLIKCHSLNPSPEYQDFEVDLNEVKQLLNIIKVQSDISF